MIVRDEEKDLPSFIQRHQNLFDEWIILDTGSCDRTLSIIKEAGLPVHTFEWIDDFSAARNHALSLCTGEWVMALDADEFLLPQHQEQIREILPNAPFDAVDFTIYNYISEERLLEDHGGQLIEYSPPDGSYREATGSQQDYGYITTRLLRAFRNQGLYHWHSPIHEVLRSQPDAKPGKAVHVDDWIIHHLGMLAPKKQSKTKTARYRDIAQKLLQEALETSDPKLLFEAGRMQEDPNQRLNCLQQALALAPKDPGILKALANAHLEMGNLEEAQAFCRSLTLRQPEELEGYLALARCTALRSGPQEALKDLKEEMRRFRHHPLWHYTLALLHLEARQYPEAHSYAQRAHEMAPNSQTFAALAQKLATLTPHV